MGRISISPITYKFVNKNDENDIVIESWNNSELVDDFLKKNPEYKLEIKKEIIEETVESEIKELGMKIQKPESKSRTYIIIPKVKEVSEINGTSGISLKDDEVENWLKENPEYDLRLPGSTKMHYSSLRTNIKHGHDMKFMLDSMKKNNKYNNMQY